ncbi:MAG: hypothetical protein CMF62_01975 [Magnetococcales bacterium]|nr:hypothetical protein [Magnetococcales bacterium]
MRIYVLPNSNIVIGCSAKCGSTSLKKQFLNKLNIKKEYNNVDEFHNYIDTNIINNPKYNIYGLKYYRRIKSRIPVGNFYSVLIMRNPFARLISGLKEKANRLTNKFNLGEYTVREFLYLLKEKNYFINEASFISHHFRPQTDYENGKIHKFNTILDISDINIISKLLNVSYKNKPMNSTKYLKNDDNDKKTYQDLQIKNLSKIKLSNDPKKWFESNEIDLIYELYKDDFRLASQYNISYKID